MRGACKRFPVVELPRPVAINKAHSLCITMEHVSTHSKDFNKSRLSRSVRADDPHSATQAQRATNINQARSGSSGIGVGAIADLHDGPRIRTNAH